ncbi:hypothetical protein [Actinoplanes philippinensis]|uniref:hypothetical protein n=1 Tax=Actinoplanes philippinensis TaxID=35752 RepID=UPI0033C64062
MKWYHPALVTAAVLATAGCSTPESPAPAAPAPATSSPAPSPGLAGPSPREQLLAALAKSRTTTYRFTTDGEVPDGQKVTGSGVHDPKAGRISMKYTLTGTGSTQRIVIGSDLYSRPADGETWVHLDLKRIKADSPYAFDMTDPTGLSRFAEAIDEVAGIGPNTYGGTLDIDSDRFLPVGTPAVSVLGGGAAFTATTDAAGWVTSIKVSLKDGKDTLEMTTTLSAHGKASGIRKPAKSGEAMDFYYD